MQIEIPPRPRDLRRILFSGYFGGGNLGDEALLSAELGRFREALRGPLEPVVATVDPVLTRRLHGEIATVPFFDVKALSAAIAASDLVVWGGGGLLQDHWHVPVEELFLDPRGGVPAYLRVPLLAAAWGRPCMVYGQGVGPLSVPENRRLVGLALSGVDAITVRDAASADLLRECGVTGRPILTTADPVVSIRPAPAERGSELIAGTGLDPGRRPIVAVTPRVPPNGNVSWVGPLSSALKDFGREAGASVLFIPFDQEKGKRHPDLSGARREVLVVASRRGPERLALPGRRGRVPRPVRCDDRHEASRPLPVRPDGDARDRPRLRPEGPRGRRGIRL